MLGLTGCSVEKRKFTDLSLKVENETGWDLKIYLKENGHPETQLDPSNGVYSIQGLTLKDTVILRFFGKNDGQKEKEVELVLGDSVKFDITLFFNSASFKDSSSICSIDHMTAKGLDHIISKVCRANSNNCFRTFWVLNWAKIEPATKLDIWELGFSITNTGKYPKILISGVYNPTIKDIIIDDL